MQLAGQQLDSRFRRRPLSQGTKTECDRAGHSRPCLCRHGHMHLHIAHRCCSSLLSVAGINNDQKQSGSRGGDCFSIHHPERSRQQLEGRN